MDKFLNRLKEQAAENPLMALAAGAAAMTAASKLIDAASSIRSRNAYAKRMNPKKSRR